MTSRSFLSALSAACMGLAGAAGAQQHDPATPAAVAAKVALRGEANGIACLVSTSGAADATPSVHRGCRPHIPTNRYSNNKS